MVVRAIVLGLGDRGTIYASYALRHPDELVITGAADPNPQKREIFSSGHGITAAAVVESWEELLERPKFADAVIIALPDSLHFQAAKMALEKDYHVLLEKPMATEPGQILQLQGLEAESEGILQVCHVLRYTEFYQLVKEYITSGKLGEVINIQMSENVSYFHYAHSYIRGNWNNRDETAPMILTKSSHDLDLLYWFAGSTPRSISSFGGQRFFGSEHKPEGSPDRCTDDCPVADTCLYYAPRIYLDIIPLLHAQTKSPSYLDRIVANSVLQYPRLRELPGFSKVKKYRGWPVNVITEDPTYENKVKALNEGPYGLCVYDHSGHDVVDHQVVNIIFDNGITASFSLHGHSSEERRIIRIDGTRGTIEGRFSYVGNHLEYTNSLTNKTDILISGKGPDGHGGGDDQIMSDFLSAVSSRSSGGTSGKVSMVSHLLAFAADKARLDESVVDYREFLRSI